MAKALNNQRKLDKSNPTYFTITVARKEGLVKVEATYVSHRGTDAIGMVGQEQHYREMRRLCTYVRLAAEAHLRVGKFPCWDQPSWSHVCDVQRKWLDRLHKKGVGVYSSGTAHGYVCCDYWYKTWERHGWPKFNRSPKVSR